MIKLILFDVDGVLSDWTYRKYSDHVAKLSGADAKEANEWIGEKRHLLDEGKLTNAEFEAVVAKKYGLRREDVRYPSFYVKNTTFSKEMLGLAMDLKNRYVMAILTNSDRGRYRYTKKVLESIFRYRFISSNQRVRKPFDGAYMGALKKTGFRAEEALFIDDTERNVAAARRLGMDGIHFTTYEALLTELSNRGIVVSKG